MSLTKSFDVLRRTYPLIQVVLATIALDCVALAQRPASEYIVGPNDVLSVTVFNQDKLTNKYPVGADGTFSFPYLGRVTAGGLTVLAVENDIRSRLGKEFLKDPQVTVAVEQYRSQQVYVLGQVRQPQPLQFTGSMSLIEALARVGSVNERAGVEALIIRSPNGRVPDKATLEHAASPTTSGDQKIIKINLEALQAGDATQNVALQSGDVVSIPLAKTAFAKGHVAKPGEYPIRAGMTVQQLLVLAGGITDRGSEGRIQIIRKVGGKKTTLDATVDDLVQADDTIDVRQRFF